MASEKLGTHPLAAQRFVNAAFVTCDRAHAPHPLRVVFIKCIVYLKISRVLDIESAVTSARLMILIIRLATAAGVLPRPGKERDVAGERSIFSIGGRPARRCHAERRRPHSFIFERRRCRAKRKPRPRRIKKGFRNVPTDGSIALNGKKKRQRKPMECIQQSNETRADPTSFENYKH
ncbi:hypothetical protein EVAR_41255_1 [Eumeta japonica]|uniref:Uncharacterized protein n=1 Tax=Eumeta variegata TaxID=151549 RepID=A0A4C1W4M9_EUMVA|nr:hypothetical protein EVAR_41255_1 [Eumeta japonica]